MLQRAAFFDLNELGAYQIFSLDRFIILHSLLSKPRSQIANDIEYMRLTRRPHRNLRLMRQKEIAITSNYVTFVGYRVTLAAKQLGTTELAHF